MRRGQPRSEQPAGGSWSSRQPRLIHVFPGMTARGRQRVIRGFDQQVSIAEDAELAYRVSRGGEPERTHLLVGMNDMNAAGPERWISSRCSVDADDRVVGGIHPDLSIDEVLAVFDRRNLQHISGTPV